MNITECNIIRTSARARTAAALAASGLSLGVMGLMAPAASAATAGPAGNNGCHTDPSDGGFYCTIFDISPVAKPVLDVAIGVTCLNAQAEDPIKCMLDTDVETGLPQ